MTTYYTLHEHEEDKIDIVRELRLRRWARVHFVEERDRKPHWHPVVLDEMKRCDSECSSQKQLSPMVSTYVPIAPSAPHFVSDEYKNTDSQRYWQTTFDFP